MLPPLHMTVCFCCCGDRCVPPGANVCPFTTFRKLFCCCCVLLLLCCVWFCECCTCTWWCEWARWDTGCEFTCRGEDFKMETTLYALFIWNCWWVELCCGRDCCCFDGGICNCTCTWDEYFSDFLFVSKIYKEFFIFFFCYTLYIEKPK